jgi:hypothetical protein
LVLDEAGCDVDDGAKQRLLTAATQLAPSVRQHWRAACGNLMRPLAREQAAYLDYSLPLGVAARRRDGKPVQHYVEFAKWCAIVGSV